MHKPVDAPIRLLYYFSSYADISGATESYSTAAVGKQANRQISPRNKTYIVLTSKIIGKYIFAVDWLAFAAFLAACPAISFFFNYFFRHGGEGRYRLGVQLLGLFFSLLLSRGLLSKSASETRSKSNVGKMEFQWIYFRGSTFSFDVQPPLQCCWAGL